MLEDKQNIKFGCICETHQHLSLVFMSVLWLLFLNSSKLLIYFFQTCFGGVLEKSKQKGARLELKRRKSRQNKPAAKLLDRQGKWRNQHQEELLFSLFYVFTQLMLHFDIHICVFYSIVEKQTSLGLVVNIYVLDFQSNEVFMLSMCVLMLVILLFY